MTTEVFSHRSLSGRAVFSLGLGLSLLSSLPAAAQFPSAQTMPRGAFLRHPVADVRALANQVKTDKVVCTRYARLFHLSPTMVQKAISRMHLIRLPEDRALQVHYIHPGEQIGYKLRRVRKGTLAFALADGTPALLKVCGNPLRNSLTEDGGGAHSSSIPDFRPDEQVGGFAPTPETPQFDGLRPSTPTLALGDTRPITPQPSAKALPVSLPTVTIDTFSPPSPTSADTTPVAESIGTGGGHSLNLVGLASGLAGALSAFALLDTGHGGATSTDDLQRSPDVLEPHKIPATPHGTSSQLTKQATQQVHDWIDNHTHDTLTLPSVSGWSAGKHNGGKLPTITHSSHLDELEKKPFEQTSAVPEPGLVTMLWATLGTGAALARRRRQKAIRQN